MPFSDMTSGNQTKMFTFPSDYDFNKLLSLFLVVSVN